MGVCPFEKRVAHWKRGVCFFRVDPFTLCAIMSTDRWLALFRPRLRLAWALSSGGVLRAALTYEAPVVLPFLASSFHAMQDFRAFPRQYIAILYTAI